jgi:hypothetical protein
MKRIIFVCLAVWFATSLASAQKAASMSVAEEVYSFGNIVKTKGKVTHTFEIKNDGKQPLVSSRVITSCGCASPVWPKEPIAPGKTGSVVVTLDPHRQATGLFTKTVTISTNAKQSPAVIIITGTII